MASNFNDSTPAAPAGTTNVAWQQDGSGNISANVPTAPPSPTVNAQTGTSYTGAIGDENNITTMNNASANTFTVPPNASVAYPIGTVLAVIQLGAGQTSFLAGAGVTLNNPSSLNARAQYSTISALQIATDVWIIAGDLA